MKPIRGLRFRVRVWLRRRELAEAWKARAEVPPRLHRGGRVLWGSLLAALFWHKHVRPKFNKLRRWFWLNLSALVDVS